jgi:hypothetical protein
MFEQFK